MRGISKREIYQKKEEFKMRRKIVNFSSKVPTACKI